MRFVGSLGLPKKQSRQKSPSENSQQKQHQEKVKRAAVFQAEFREDLAYWIKEDTRIAEKILDLVEEVLKDPFKGKGKPEALKHLDPNTWSRRLTLEHRLVYLVSHNKIDFLQARYHY